jgi:hypothetical protein
MAGAHLTCLMDETKTNWVFGRKMIAIIIQATGPSRSSSRTRISRHDTGQQRCIMLFMRMQFCICLIYFEINPLEDLYCRYSLSIK